jgi:hypothetical protein
MERQLLGGGRPPIVSTNDASSAIGEARADGCCSFLQGGFRGIGFVHSPLLAKKGTVYAPLLHVSDWYRTLLGAALSGDSAAARSAAQKQLAPLLAAGAIDSVDQWAAISAGASASLSDADPRTEVLLAGIDSDKHGAAIRVGAYKLLIGDWGADTWCDLNVSGLSPAYPAPARSQGSTSIGGEGGLVCVHLNGSSRGSSPPYARRCHPLLSI